MLHKFVMHGIKSIILITYINEVHLFLKSLSNWGYSEVVRINLLMFCVNTTERVNTHIVFEHYVVINMFTILNYNISHA